MSKLLFISIALIAVAVGFYWLNTNSEVKTPAVEQAIILPKTKLENSSTDAILLPRESSEPNQLQTAYSERIDAAGEAETITLDSFIGVDDYSYQRDNREPINVGEVKNADDSSYQRDDRKVVNVGEIMDVKLLDSTY